MDNPNAPVRQTPADKAREFVRSLNLRDPKVIGFALLILAAIVGVIASRDETPEKPAKPDDKRPDPAAPVNVHVHNHGPRVRAVKPAEKPDDKPDDKPGDKTPKDEPPENPDDEIVAK